MVKIDLNADLGEGGSADAALMTLVSSVNIACGFHAGDAQTMLESVRHAINNGVAGHIHQRQQNQNQIRLGNGKDIRQNVQDFLKELNRQRDKRQRKAKIDGSQYPARGVHGIFKKAFHKVLFAKETSAQYIPMALTVCNSSPVWSLRRCRG